MATKIGEQLQSVFLKCTSAFTLDGAIIKADQIVEVLEDDAKALLARGKAELATIEHAIAAGLVSADEAAADAELAEPTAGDAAAPDAAAADASQS